MITNRLTRWLARRVGEACVARVLDRPADFVIGGNDRPYLLRWWLVPRNPVFNVYLHCFLRDDDDRALHDHPWPSLSLSLGRPLQTEMNGVRIDPSAHLEEVYKDRRGDERHRTIPFGALVWRGPKFAHRLIVPVAGVLTIFITGPRVRAWGFHCPQGWRHWKEFTGYAQHGDSARVGKGCE